MSKKKTSRSPQSGEPPAGGPMDVALLQRLVSLMAANDLNTVDLRDGPRRIVLRRGAAAPAPIAAALPLPVPASSQPAAVPAGPAPSAEENLKPIKSPMVGTFYSAPAPDASPFVSVGSAVDEDTDVCIIEAMKVFNNIKAEVRGTIARILIENGQPVEFGQVLFLVKPS